MDGWVGEWVGGWVGRWIDGWMDDMIRIWMRHSTHCCTDPMAPENQAMVVLSQAVLSFQSLFPRRVPREHGQ